MHVHNPAGERCQQRRLDHAHVTRQRHQLDIGLLQHGHDLLLEVRFQFRLELARADEPRRDPTLAAPLQNGSERDITQDQRDRPGYLAALASRQDGLAIRPAARPQHPDA